MLNEIHSRRSDGRRQPENYPGQQGERQREGNYASVQLHLIEAWNVARADRNKQVDNPESQQYSYHSTRQSKNHGFSQQLANQGPPARAKRRANRELFPARR